MFTTELLDFIKAERALGQTDDAITEILVAGGWDRVDAREAFQEIARKDTAKPASPHGGGIVPLSDEDFLGVFALNSEIPQAEPLSHKPAGVVKDEKAPVQAAPVIKPLITPGAAPAIKINPLIQQKPQETPKVAPSVVISIPSNAGGQQVSPIIPLQPKITTPPKVESTPPVAAPLPVTKPTPVTPVSLPAPVIHIDPLAQKPAPVLTPVVSVPTSTPPVAMPITKTKEPDVVLPGAVTVEETAPTPSIVPVEKKIEPPIATSTPIIKGAASASVSIPVPQPSAPPIVITPLTPHVATPVTHPSSQPAQPQSSGRTSSIAFARRVMPQVAENSPKSQGVPGGWGGKNITPTPAPVAPPKVVHSVSIADFWATHKPAEPAAKPSAAGISLPAQPAVTPVTAEGKTAPTLVIASGVPHAAPIAVSMPTPQVTAGLSLRETSSRTKKLVFGGIGLVVLLALVGVGVYALWPKPKPVEDKVLATMYASIPGFKTVSYKGATKLDIAGEVVDAARAQLELGQSGAMTLAFNYEGKIDFPADGVNSVHQLGIDTTMRSGNIDIKIQSNVEVRMLGDTMYIRVSNPPDIGDIDLSPLRNYWVALSAKDLIQYMGLTLIPDPDATAYGSFGGSGTSTATLRGLIAEYVPVRTVEKLADDLISGVDTYHYRFKVNAENVYQLLDIMSRRLRDKSLEMSPEEHTNLVAVLDAITGDIWIDKATFLPRKFLFTHQVNDTISGIAVRGNIDTEQEFTAYNVPVKVEIPSPTVTYKELSDSIARQIGKQNLTGDALRVADVEGLVAALAMYRQTHGDRYPSTLDGLVDDGLLKDLPVDPEGREYAYVAYTVVGKGEKATKCIVTASSTPQCVFYHLGATLDDPLNPSLLIDVDFSSEAVKGDDKKGCKGEAKKACYDITPLP